MPELVLLRHGESLWNRANRFTGWTDVDLSDAGRDEAKRAGQLMLQQQIPIDVAYTSVLKRAIRTLWIVLDELDRMWVPVDRSWRLNERHYGALQGRDKAETAEQVGAEQVRLWRRSYDQRPPLLATDDERHPSRDRRYRELPPSALPRGESLADTVARLIPYWQGSIVPALRGGKHPVVVAHGNSLRGLIAHLEGIAPSDVRSLEIPTGVPIVYDLDSRLRPVGKRMLGGEDWASKGSP